jgi:hypothetical protein
MNNLQIAGAASHVLLSKLFRFTSGAASRQRSCRGVRARQRQPATIPPSSIQMASENQFWSPDDWEQWIDRLLKARYGHTGYQRVPARVRGDLGIEGYSTDGCVYQCYSPTEPLSTEQRYAKHRIKMTEDIGKFIAYKDELSSLFSTMMIKRWILLIPLYDDKAILLHAAKKTEAVRAARLPYVDDDFRVHVADASYFEVEANALAAISPVLIAPLPNDPQPGDVTDWADANPQQLDVLDEKIARIPGLPAGKRAEFRDSLVERYIHGQNTLHGFHEMWPELAEVIVQSKRARASSLALECALSTVPGNDLVLGVFRDYARQLQQSVSGLPETTAHALGWDAVVEWLFTCPLEIRQTT